MYCHYRAIDGICIAHCRAIGGIYIAHCRAIGGICIAHCRLSVAVNTNSIIQILINFTTQ